MTTPKPDPQNGAGMEWPRKWLYILTLVGGMAWGLWFIWKASSVP